MTKYVEGLDYHAALEDRGQYILVAMKGHFSGEALAGGVNPWEPAVQFCRERECFNTLIDCRGLEVDVRLYHVIRVALDLSIFRDIPLRVALLVKAEAIRPDHAFEAVAAQEGVAVEVFTEFDDALTWLLSDRR